MKIKMKLAMIAVLGSQLAHGPVLAQRSVPFTHLRLNPDDASGNDIRGQVGHHLSAGAFYIVEDDLPAGNTGRPSSGTCNAIADYVSHTGSIPPGLVVNGTVGGGPMFSGTPRQPGRWEITLVANVGCRGGPDLARYDRLVRAIITIQP